MKSDYEYITDEHIEDIADKLRRSAKTSHVLEFKFIIKETHKAWLLKMTGNARQWFPKKFCKLDEENKLIAFPKWIYDQKLNEAFKKISAKNQQLKLQL